LDINEEPYEDKSPVLIDRLELIYLSCFSGLVWIAAVGEFIYMLTDFSRQCYSGFCGVLIVVEFFYVIYAPSLLFHLWSKHKEGDLSSPNNDMRTLFFVTLAYIPFLYFWGTIVWMCVERIPFE